MKKLLLSMAIPAGFASSALAADLGRAPAYKAPPMAVAHSWTGCYIGAGGGYGMYNVEHSQRDSLTGVGTTINATSGGRGWLATGQGGRDYQFNDRWGVGLFGDFDWTHFRGDYGATIPVCGAVFAVWKVKKTL